MTDSARLSPQESMAFIGGGNMASAILGGLIQPGPPAPRIEGGGAFEEARKPPQPSFGVQANAARGPQAPSARPGGWAVEDPRVHGGGLAAGPGWR